MRNPLCSSKWHLVETPSSSSSPALLLPTAIFLHSRFSVFGVFRSHFRSAPSFAADNELLMLDSLKQCEDLELVGGKIYTACQGNAEGRWGWWPPLLTLDRPDGARIADGGLFVIDTEVSVGPVRGMT